MSPGSITQSHQKVEELSGEPLHERLVIQMIDEVCHSTIHMNLKRL